MNVVTPLEDRIVVKKVEISKVRNSGLIIPDSMREQSDRGEVIAIGPGRASTQVDGTPCVVPISGIEVGDIVLFSPYAGSPVVFEDYEFLILRVGDVLGVLDAASLGVGEPGEIAHVGA